MKLRKSGLILIFIITAFLQFKDTKAFSLGGLVLGALGELGNDFIGEGISSIFDFFGIDSKLNEIIDKLNQVLQGIQEIEATENEILTLVGDVAIHIEKLLVQESLKDPLSVIDSVFTDFYSFVKRLGSGSYNKNDNSNTLDTTGSIVADQAALVAKIDTQIGPAVERLHESAIDFLKYQIEQSTYEGVDIFNVNVRLSYALTRFGNAYKRANTLLFFAKHHTAYLEGMYNTTILYYYSLKSWQDTYVITSLTPMIASILDGKEYSVPPYNQIRGPDFQYCFYAYAFSRIDGRTDIGTPTNDSCDGAGAWNYLYFAPVPNPLNSSIYVYARINGAPDKAHYWQWDGTNNVISTGPISTAKNWTLQHYSPGQTFISYNQTLNFFQFQIAPNSWVLGSWGGWNTGLNPFKKSTSQTRATAWTFSPNPDVTPYWQPPVNKAYYSITLFGQRLKTLGLSSKGVEGLYSNLYLDWNNASTIDTFSSLQNQWLFIQTRADQTPTYLIINRYYNLALTAVNYASVSLSPLFPMNNGYYNQTADNTYTNQEWILQGATGTSPFWTDDWANTKLFTQLDKQTIKNPDNNNDIIIGHNFSVAIPSASNRTIDLDATSLPLPLSIKRTAMKAREERFYIGDSDNSPIDSWVELGSGKTYKIGTWANACRSISVKNYNDPSQTPASALAWDDGIILAKGGQLTDTYWLFTEGIDDGGQRYYTISHLVILNGTSQSVCLVSSGTLQISNCDPNSILQRWKITADPDFAGLAYTLLNIGSQNYLKQKTSTTDNTGNGDIFDFANVRPQAVNRETSARFRLYYIHS